MITPGTVRCAEVGKRAEIYGVLRKAVPNFCAETALPGKP
jgi:hypothetical protein